MRRMWINQPSKFQTHHAKHGVKVLADDKPDGQCCTVYFLAGDIISMRIETSCLSAGWISAAPVTLDHPKATFFYEAIDVASGPVQVEGFFGFSKYLFRTQESRAAWLADKGTHGLTLYDRYWDASVLSHWLKSGHARLMDD